MNNRFYVLKVTKTSQDTETRDFTPYDDPIIAKRKYHETLTSIGTGLKGIAVLLLDPWLNVVAKEIWTEPEPEPTPEPEPIEEPVEEPEPTEEPTEE